MQIFARRCIPHLLGVKVDENPLALIMEFVGEGCQSVTVHKLLFSPSLKKNKCEISIKDWLCICYDITDALHHIHKKGYLHCDLKTDNVLVSQQKGYLIDFGKVQEMAHPSAKEYSTRSAER